MSRYIQHKRDQIITRPTVRYLHSGYGTTIRSDLRSGTSTSIWTVTIANSEQRHDWIRYRCRAMTSNDEGFHRATRDNPHRTINHRRLNDIDDLRSGIDWIPRSRSMHDSACTRYCTSPWVLLLTYRTLLHKLLFLYYLVNMI